MIVFFSGGCINGKSTLAQYTAKTLGGSGALWYVATMIPHDEEDRARIRRHIAERDGWGFETIEIGRQISECLSFTGGKGAFLVDSVTALLSNEMFRPDGSFDPAAPERTAADLLRFLDGAEHAVLVSDFIYADAGRYDQWTEAYRKGLAHVDRVLAKRSDTVVEVCSGNIILHKGELPR